MASMNPSVSCDALVVGAGPSGLTLASHLHRYGMSCRIIDKRATGSDRSKALVIWGRTMEMLEELGIAEHFIAAGMFARAARIHGGGRLLTRIPLEVEGTRYAKPLMLAQSETERLLSEHLTGVGIVIEREKELAAFTDRGDGVTAVVRRSDGQEERIECNWLLGCDGAHSTTRKQAGLDFAGEEDPSDWILADCHIEGRIPWDELSLIWHRKGVVAVIPLTPSHSRVIANVGRHSGNESPADPTLEQVQTVMDERGLKGVRLSDPLWLSSFRIHERKVDEYRRGRVFLVGDAAHIHSPAGGQGMNTGMQDAWNLAWKLALVESMRAHPALLASYSEEREKVGATVLKGATRLTRIATLHNPIGQMIRNGAIWALGHLAGFRRRFVRFLSEMAVHYPDSPLNGESGSRRWARGGAGPGDRLPDCLVWEAGMKTQQHLLTILRGPQHRLLLLVPPDAEMSTLLEMRRIQEQIQAHYPELVRTYSFIEGKQIPEALAGQEAVWMDPSGQVRKLVGARASSLVLVRPDGYLTYRGQPPSWPGLEQHMSSYLLARAGGGEEKERSASSPEGHSGRMRG